MEQCSASRRLRAMQAVIGAALALSAVTAHAAFEYHVYIPGLVVTTASAPAPAPGDPLSLSLMSAALPEAIVGAPYSAYDFKPLLTMSGNPLPALSAVSWSTFGALPAGMSLNASGVLTGTPTVKDEAGASVPIQAGYQGTAGQRTYLLRILNPVVSLSTAALPVGMVGQAYSYDFKSRLGVTGDPNYSADTATFSTSDTLPTGLSLGADGVLSGTPTVSNSTGVPVQVTATYKTKTGQQAYTILVEGVALRVTQVTTGWFHSCALTAEGGVKCWGRGANGQLGNGGTASSSIPVDVTGLTTGVVQVAAGSFHTCAVTTTGALKCWGLNTYGQLGNGTTTQSNSPVDVVGLSSGVARVANGDYHSCAVTSTGGAKCWGHNTYGQLGNSTTTQSLTPVDVTGLSAGVRDIVLGTYHTCASTSAGGAKCWGQNGAGQLGNGATSNRSSPVDVIGLESSTARIAAGGNFACAVTTAGGAKCWGQNAYGQLGIGTTSSSSTAVEVAGLSANISQVVAGSAYACAVTTSGIAKCWGQNNNGQLGDGSTTQRTMPVDVVGLSTGVARLAASSTHTCAVTAGGAAKCWGYNYHGQLGNGTTASSVTPVSVAP